MQPMLLTTTTLKVVLLSLLFGLVLGWHGLFAVTVWALVALVPAVVLDWVLHACGFNAARCPVR